jgi:lysyl endopeptidase
MNRRPQSSHRMAGVAVVALAAFSCLLAAPAAAARPDDGPLGLTRPVLSDEDIDQQFLRFVDVQSLRFADDDNALRPGVPFRVAEPQPAHFTLAASGTWEKLPDGRLWRLRVTSPGAVFLSFGLSDFALSPGARLSFYSVDRRYQDGPYTARNNNPDRVFQSPAIPGDSGVIELFVPRQPRGSAAPSLVVSSVSHGYRDWNGFARVPLRNGLPNIDRVTSALGACERDVNCSEGSSWQADKRAVARTYDGRFLCTGTLVNNGRQDCRNLFLTANHCVSRSQTASGMVFYWNYENSTCGGNDASTGFTSTGSALRATNSASDFTLLELSSAPSAAFSVYYAGWNRSAAAPSSGVGIHHPTGAAKKISFENNPLQDGGGFTGGWGGTHWRVTGWDSGTTEGGSSGSGIWNSSHQVVGQLHGGTADCSGGWDEYGKLASSWTLGASTLLDPNNAGLVSIGGKESSTCGGGSCAPAGQSCTDNAQCCSGSCTGKKGRKTCG